MHFIVDLAPKWPREKRPLTTLCCILSLNLNVRRDRGSKSFTSFSCGPPYKAGRILLERRTATTPGTSRPTLFELCVWVLKRPSLKFKHRSYCATGPTVYSPYSPYPWRLESLTICWCNYKGCTFSLVIFRPWVLVRPKSNSRPPARQPDAQPTEPPMSSPLPSFLFKLPTIIRKSSTRLFRSRIFANFIYHSIVSNYDHLV